MLGYFGNRRITLFDRDCEHNHFVSADIKIWLFLLNFYFVLYFAFVWLEKKFWIMVDNNDMGKYSSILNSKFQIFEQIHIFERLDINSE